jgi:hypothetical protein
MEWTLSGACACRSPCSSAESDPDTKTLMEAEGTARRQKEEARRKLHAAMARDLDPTPEPLTPDKPAR